MLNGYETQSSLSLRNIRFCSLTVGYIPRKIGRQAVSYLNTIHWTSIGA